MAVPFKRRLKLSENIFLSIGELYLHFGLTQCPHWATILQLHFYFMFFFQHSLHEHPKSYQSITKRHLTLDTFAVSWGHSFSVTSSVSWYIVSNEVKIDYSSKSQIIICLSELFKHISKQQILLNIKMVTKKWNTFMWSSINCFITVLVEYYPKIPIVYKKRLCCFNNKIVLFKDNSNKCINQCASFADLNEQTAPPQGCSGWKD